MYPDGTRAVSDMSLGIEDGEFMVLVGPSGCGKTTALRMVAGLEEISEGVLRIGDRVVNHVPSRDRDIAMVFQSYALYPHLSVYDNIAFGLKLRKEKKAEIDTRVQEAARILGLEPFLKRKPRALSGGQRQRVAMGRAIVRRAAGFSHGRAALEPRRKAARADARGDRAHPGRPRRHDDLRHARPGRGDDDGRPRRRHAQGRAAAGRGARRSSTTDPVNLFVGGFIGSPAMNLIEATLERVERNAARVRSATSASRSARRCSTGGPALKGFEGKLVVLGIRPEDLEDAAIETDAPPDHRLQGKVELTEALGSEIMVHIGVGARPALTEDVRELAEDLGDERAAAEAEEAAHTTMVGRFSPRSQVNEGDTVEVVVDTSSLHFFDPETGLGIYDNDQAKGA